MPKKLGSRKNRPTIIGENEASDNHGKSLKVFYFIVIWTLNHPRPHLTFKFCTLLFQTIVRTTNVYF